jgi:hypothetical protein
MGVPHQIMGDASPVFSLDTPLIFPDLGAPEVPVWRPQTRSYEKFIFVITTNEIVTVSHVTVYGLYMIL